MSLRLEIAPSLNGVVGAAAIEVDDIVARSPEPNLDAPLAAAVAEIAKWADAPAATEATRTMYKRVGIDPTKTRPSSEALLRRIRRGDPFPRINGVVDVINWTSVETQMSFGVYDLDRIDAPDEVVHLRLGLPGEEYAGIRKDAVHVAGRLTLVDRRGPFGNPTSDSARTMVTPEARRVWVVVFAPAGLTAAGQNAAMLTRDRLRAYCARS